MCLYIEKDAVAAIAEEDIEVYKVLRYMPEHDRYDSPYQEYEYPMGVNPPVVHESALQTYSRIIGTRGTIGDVMHLDYHQDIINLTFTIPERMPNVGYLRIMVVEDGLHTFASLDDAKGYESSHNRWVQTMRIVRCVIPKGAKYYKGIWPYRSVDKNMSCESYASSQLIAHEVLPCPTLKNLA